MGAVIAIVLAVAIGVGISHTDTRPTVERDYSTDQAQYIVTQSPASARRFVQPAAGESQFSGGAQ